MMPHLARNCWQEESARRGNDRESVPGRNSIPRACGGPTRSCSTRANRRQRSGGDLDKSRAEADQSAGRTVRPGAGRRPKGARTGNRPQGDRGAAEDRQCRCLIGLRDPHRFALSALAARPSSRPADRAAALRYHRRCGLMCRGRGLRGGRTGFHSMWPRVNTRIAQQARNHLIFLFRAARGHGQSALQAGPDGKAGLCRGGTDHRWPTDDEPDLADPHRDGYLQASSISSPAGRFAAAHALARWPPSTCRARNLRR